jgi:DNA modification methylase
VSVRIIEGDCREVLRTLPDASVHSIVTDPPYELGFMGKAWDRSGIAYDNRVWHECFRVLKPGGHLLSFGGSRTYHRMACAIEDSHTIVDGKIVRDGFEIRDQIMWIYGSGFPKSKNLDGDWDGWGTALKPAHEPIVVARKPLIGTVAANVEAHRTGALNIDGCRVGSDGGCAGAAINCFGGGLNGTFAQPVPGLGRWPANVAHDGSDEVLAAFPIASGAQAPVTGLEPSASTSHIYGKFRRAASDRGTGGIWSGISNHPCGPQYGDDGSAARFFYCAKASREDRNIGCDDLPDVAGGMVNNTSGQHITRRDGGAPGPTKNNHPTVKPTELMRWLVRLVTPPGGTVLDPFAGSGSTGRAADIEGFDAILIELSPEYAAIARKRISGDAPLFAELSA